MHGAYGKTGLIPARGAILACVAFATTACGSQDLWQGEEVLVEARQVTLERSVVDVSEDNRELKDRFNALERLYVDLVRHSREQEAKIASLEARLANFKKDPEAQAAINRVTNSLSNVRKEIKSLENRVFSVEAGERNAVFNAARAAEAAKKKAEEAEVTSAVDQQSPENDTAPTGTVQQGADVETGDLGTPVSSASDDGKTYYGVHLASYRSRDQVSSGWSSLFRAFGGELQGLTPLIYTQNQEGIGTFLRLIVGPLDTEGEAESLCNTIQDAGGEQYCKVSEYQGEPIG